MSKKMILIPMERLRYMESAVSKSASATPLANNRQMQPDVELKLLTNKKFRKRHINVNHKQQPPPPPQQQLLTHQQHTPCPNTPVINSFKGKKRARAKTFVKHLARHNDMYIYNKI